MNELPSELRAAASALCSCLIGNLLFLIQLDCSQRAEKDDNETYQSGLLMRRISLNELLPTTYKRQLRPVQTGTVDDELRKAIK